jgi:hypothetical protein
LKYHYILQLRGSLLQAGQASDFSTPYLAALRS